MTEPTDKVDTPDARQASMARVQTHESLLASLAPPALVEATEESKETKVDDKPKDGEQKPKQSANERIRELAAKRQAAEAKAEDAERRAQLLEMKLKALESPPPPMEAVDKPKRANYASDDDFTDAVADWKADQRIAKREAEREQARQQAEYDEFRKKWDQRVENISKVIPDYAEVVGKSTVNLKDHVYAAVLDSDLGEQIVYYLATNPEEATKMNGMTPIKAVKHVLALERDLADLDDDTPPTAAKPQAPAPKQSKAPEPINPVRGAGAAVSTGTLPTDYAAFKRHREAMKRK